VRLIIQDYSRTNTRNTRQANKALNTACDVRNRFLPKEAFILQLMRAPDNARRTIAKTVLHPPSGGHKGAKSPTARYLPRNKASPHTRPSLSLLFFLSFSLRPSPSFSMYNFILLLALR